MPLWPGKENWRKGIVDHSRTPEMTAWWIREKACSLRNWEQDLRGLMKNSSRGEWRAVKRRGDDGVKGITMLRLPTHPHASSSAIPQSREHVQGRSSQRTWRAQDQQPRGREGLPGMSLKARGLGTCRGNHTRFYMIFAGRQLLWVVPEKMLSEPGKHTHCYFLNLNKWLINDSCLTWLVIYQCLHFISQKKRFMSFAISTLWYASRHKLESWS